MLVNRDPFARIELHRRTKPRDERRPCGWCGREGRFVYYVETDGGRKADITGEFCSKGCMEAYHS